MVDNSYECELWNLACETARDFLINTADKAKELELSYVHPLQATRYDGNGHASGISRPTENKGISMASIKIDVNHYKTWLSAVYQLERQLLPREQQILAVWRVKRKRGQTKSDLMYEMFQGVERYEDMRIKFVELVVRCASKVV